MTWFKVDDAFAFHRKVISAGNSALGLWVRAGSWCSGNLTDGALPRHMIGTLGAQARDARRLVDAGLWCETKDGYQFNDWHHYQFSKEQVTAERRATRERVRKWREEQRNGVSNAVTNTVSNGVSTPAPSRPVVSSGLGSQSGVGRTDEAPIDGLDYARITKALGPGTRTGRAHLVAGQILAKAPRPPGNATAYVVNAITREPHLYRETSGPPAVGDLCSEHGRARATCPSSWHQETA